jgi:N,N'-diacetylchitobiose transport system substrate-binding protein
MWVAGGDTPQELRDYLIATFAEENPGSSLVIEEQAWGDLVTKLTTALPDAENTPDVVEIGNTQSPTFTTVGAFRDLTPLYEELGGDDLLQSFVEVGAVDGKNYALPYYFGSRYMFYRADIWSAAGLTEPTTLAEFGDAVKALRTEGQSGFAMGGQDWRNGISWVFANGGELATVDGGEWTSTLSDPNTIAGLEQWQDLYQGASNVPSTERDVAYWDFLNDGTDGAAPAAATIMAPGWARWSIGDLVTNDAGDEVRDGMADATKFAIFGLPGVDGGLAPVFAGGSNIAISAQSQNPELAENLMRIIFSEEYQTMLAQNGLGPANANYVSALGDDEFATTMIETAAGSKLTPAAPDWAAVEAAFVYEELFQKIAEGGDVTALAAEYDEIITPMLNG